MKMKRNRVVARRIGRFFSTTALGGLVVVLPLTLFFLLVRFLFNLASSFLRPVKALLPLQEAWSDWLVDLLLVAGILGAFFLIGLLVRTELGNKLVHRVEERWLGQLPFYGTIRETVRQFLGSEKPPFSRVVLVAPFLDGALMTGFVTDELPGSYFTVFVPTAPNPTNGFVFHLHADQIRWVDIRPEEAMRSIIGMGAGSRALFRQPTGDRPA